MGGIPRSYEYMKIRVRLMRTEEDVNENEEHFVHVGRGSLRSRAERVVRQLMSLALFLLCGKDYRVYGVYFAFVLRRN